MSLCYLRTSRAPVWYNWFYQCEWEAVLRVNPLSSLTQASVSMRYRLRPVSGLVPKPGRCFHLMWKAAGDERLFQRCDG